MTVPHKTAPRRSSSNFDQNRSNRSNNPYTIQSQVEPNPYTTENAYDMFQALDGEVYQTMTAPNGMMTVNSQQVS